jgi:F0F1-type ATP synthase epsilon subunit
MWGNKLDDGGISEGSLEVKLPEIWTNGKADVERAREEKRREAKRRAEKRREDQRREKSQREEDAGTRKGFSNDLWLRRVEKKARESGGCGAIWPNER